MKENKIDKFTKQKAIPSIVAQFWKKKIYWINVKLC